MKNQRIYLIYIFILLILNAILIIRFLIEPSDKTDHYPTNNSRDSSRMNTLEDDYLMVSKYGHEKIKIETFCSDETGKKDLLINIIGKGKNLFYVTLL